MQRGAGVGACEFWGLEWFGKRRVWLGTLALQRVGLQEGASVLFVFLMKQALDGAG